jgi:hypothetical protein
MRIVIETDDKAAAPAMDDHLHALPVEQPQSAQDAGPGLAAGSGPASRSASGNTGADSSQAVDAGSPPQWLVDEIARLRAGEESGTHPQNTLEDAGPAAENADAGTTNAGAADADNAGKGKKSS